MGMQINFYMNWEDEREFLDYVFGKDPVIIAVGERDTQGKFPCFDSLEGITNYEDVVKYYRFYLLRKDISDDLKVKKYPNYYYADHEESLAIEFSRSKLKSNEVESGRLYIIPED